MDELDLAIKALGVVTEGLKDSHTITHICYGDFHRAYPKILELPVDQLDLEMVNSDYDLLNVFKEHEFTKHIGLGVADSHSHRIEPEDEIIRGIERTLELVPAERVFVDPDCGLKTRTVEEAKGKMRVIVGAVEKMRARLGS
jgi:5-methyltetrahydropteroyltriglutamate--homocysteine methyltransferase